MDTHAALGEKYAENNKADGDELPGRFTAGEETDDIKVLGIQVNLDNVTYFPNLRRTKRTTAGEPSNR